MSQSWWVYMIQTCNGRLYTGIATDVERRFAEHSSGGAKAAKFFRSDPPETVVYRAPMADRSAASREEARIKSLSRAAKLALAANGHL